MAAEQSPITLSHHDGVCMGKMNGTTIVSAAPDMPAEAETFARKQVFGPDELIAPIPLGSPRLSLERVIEALHDNEINAGLQTFAWCGLRVWIGDELNGIKASARLNGGPNNHWAIDGTVALWLHRKALWLYPENPYAGRYGKDSSELAMDDIGRACSDDAASSETKSV